MQTTVVSTRVKKNVKESLEKAGVDIPKVVREHLEELAWKLQLEEEVKGLRRLLEEVKPSESGFAVKSVREDRESH
jgi:hypothetical protein